MRAGSAALGFPSHLQSTRSPWSSASGWASVYPVWSSCSSAWPAISAPSSESGAQHEIPPNPSLCVCAGGMGWRGTRNDCSALAPHGLLSSCSVLKPGQAPQRPASQDGDGRCSIRQVPRVVGNAGLQVTPGLHLLITSGGLWFCVGTQTWSRRNLRRLCR